MLEQNMQSDSKLGPPYCSNRTKRRTALNTNKLKKKPSTRPASPAPQTVLVHFEFKNPAAGEVRVAGTFNDWQPSVTEMLRQDDGRWLKELTLVPGNYEYRMVVDGEWMADPQATESVPNPFGGVNSILRVADGRIHV
jgi:1,4-alpha-glucan branching enzyme